MPMCFQVQMSTERKINLSDWLEARGPVAAPLGNAKGFTFSHVGASGHIYMRCFIAE